MNELVRAEALLSDICQLEAKDPPLSKVCQKLARKIRADASFLRKYAKDTKSDDSTLCSSNLPYLSGILDAAKQSKNVTDVICDFRSYGITVDVVADYGKTWKKVVARNPQSLHLIWAGKGQYGPKDIVKKAQKYVEAAKSFCQISPPEILYVFCNGVTFEVAEMIRSLGITVEGECVPVSTETLHRLSSVSADDSDDSDDEDLFEQARRGFQETGCDEVNKYCARLV